MSILAYNTVQQAESTTNTLTSTGGTITHTNAAGLNTRSLLDKYIFTSLAGVYTLTIEWNDTRFLKVISLLNCSFSEDKITSIKLFSGATLKATTIAKRMQSVIYSDQDIDGFNNYFIIESTDSNPFPVGNKVEIKFTRQLTPVLSGEFIGSLFFSDSIDIKISKPKWSGKDLNIVDTSNGGQNYSYNYGTLDTFNFNIVAINQSKAFDNFSSLYHLKRTVGIHLPVVIIPFEDNHLGSSSNQNSNQTIYGKFDKMISIEKYESRDEDGNWYYFSNNCSITEEL